MQYAGARVLVTGGLGFIGSNLSIRLVQEGAAVTIVDSQTPGCGGNIFNIQPIRERAVLLQSDISDARQFRKAISSADVIFNLAGEPSSIHSMQLPERDLQVNTAAQLRFLLECKAANRGVRVVYTGTRGVYGTPKYLPVDEAHPVRPLDFNGIHKYTTSMYHVMLSRARQLDCIVLNLSNVYGPRMALEPICRDFLSTYVSRLARGETVEVYGDGRQVRDPLFVDDAVNALIICGRVQSPPHRVYNVGGSEALPVTLIAEVASKAAGVTPPLNVPYPADRKWADTGSFRTDNKRIRRELEWEPHVQFAAGISATLAYYRENLTHYADSAAPNSCRLPEHSAAGKRLNPGEP